MCVSASVWGRANTPHAIAPSIPSEPAEGKSELAQASAVSQRSRIAGDPTPRVAVAQLSRPQVVRSHRRAPAWRESYVYSEASTRICRQNGANGKESYRNIRRVEPRATRDPAARGAGVFA